MIYTARVRHRFGTAADRVRQWLVCDWRTTKRLPYGVALALLVGLVTLAYYANRPSVLYWPDPDTRGYVAVAHAILTHGRLVDPMRLPGYPLFIAAIFLIAGRDNLAAVSAVQGVLFVAAIVELYALLWLVLRRSWAAFTICLLAGASPHLISYVYTPLSEGLALFLLSTLALAAAIYVQRPSAPRLWFIAGLTAALFLTRPEWIYLPVPLFGYLLFIAHRRGLSRRLLPHALGALVAVYALLGLYVQANGAVTGCRCVTYVQNINLLGKVMQYRMHREAPAGYAGMTRLVDAYITHGDDDPWDVIRAGYPPLSRNFYALAGDYSLAIIRTHPVEYVSDTVPIAAQLLTDATPFRPLLLDHTNGGWLSALDGLSRGLFPLLLVLFPLATLLWWGLLARARKDDRVLVETMAALALLAVYGLALSALGGYIYYPRLHVPFAPLLIAVAGGALVAGWPLLRRALTRD